MHLDGQETGGPTDGVVALAVKYAATGENAAPGEKTPAAVEAAAVEVAEEVEEAAVEEAAAVKAAVPVEAEAAEPEQAATEPVALNAASSRMSGRGGGGGMREAAVETVAVEAAFAILSATLAAVAAATIDFHLGRSRICSSRDGPAFCLKVSRSLLLTTPVPTTTIFEAKLMLYGIPSGTTTPVCDAAFLGGMSEVHV